MKKIWTLFLLFLISFVLRIYQVKQLPSILNRDEAALAYNAYLISETGRDEWNKAWPLSLESFGDFKLPGYVYFLVGVFKIFPLKDWVVKLPSILAGSALTFLAFYFAKVVKFREPWAWLFTILVATTPVFFFYSRIAFEANLALSLFLTALILIFTKVKGKTRLVFDLLAICLTLISVFTYNTPLLILPFILPIIIWLRGFKPYKKWLGLVIGLSLVIGLAGYQLVSLSSQKSGITIFADETTWINFVTYRQQFSGIWQSIIGNKYVYFSYLISENYVKSFSSSFLVNGVGGHPWHSLPNHGHLYGVIYFFGIIGISSVILELILAVRKHKFSSKIRIHTSLLYLLLISLLPSVVTVDSPHATRSLLFFFLFNLFTLFGLKRSYHFIRDHTQIKKNVLFFTFTSLLFISSFSYFKDYFTLYPLQQSSLLPGFDLVISQVNEDYLDQEIAVIDQEGYHYILLAWYLKISPEKFFKSTVRQLPDKIGFRYGEQVDRYHFIANLEDRGETEKVVISWSEVESKWEILEF